MKQEHWTEQLREKLNGYQEPAPEGLWDDIEAALDGGTTVVRPRTASPWRRWSVAAAVVLLLAGGSLLLWHREEANEADTTATAQLTQQPVHSSPAVQSEPAITTAAPDVTNEAQTAVATTTTKEEKTVATTSYEEQTTIAPTTTHEAPMQVAPTTTEEDVLVASATTTEEVQTATAPAATETKTAKTEPTDNPLQYVWETADAVVSHSKRQMLVAALYAGDGLADRSNVDYVQMNHSLAQKYAMLNNINASRAMEPIWLTGYEEREYHERPFTIGLQVRYPLTRRLSLTSGLAYTRLKSQFTKVMKGSEVEQEQVLHDVGLPLGLQYQLLQFGHLIIYASADGQLDWNVSARMRVNGRQTDARRDRCQWSLGGSVGLSYALTPHVGLYVEPGIRHYLDNGSNIRNYFKDRPTNISLQVGVQLNVGSK